MFGKFCCGCVGGQNWAEPELHSRSVSGSAVAVGAANAIAAEAIRSADAVPSSDLGCKAGFMGVLWSNENHRRPFAPPVDGHSPRLELSCHGR